MSDHAFRCRASSWSSHSRCAFHNAWRSSLPRIVTGLNRPRGSYVAATPWRTSRFVLASSSWCRSGTGMVSVSFRRFQMSPSTLKMSRLSKSAAGIVWRNMSELEFQQRRFMCAETETERQKDTDKRSSDFRVRISLSCKKNFVLCSVECWTKGKFRTTTISWHGTRNITTVVQGNCSQAGNYSNNTIVTLQADGSGLPFEYYILNFNSSNPMLPILKQGMVTMAGASTIVETHGGCKTNITVVPGGSGDICDEGLLVSRCH